MQCTQCQHSIADGQRFCGNCGSPAPQVILACPSCHHTVEPGKKFCTNCGMQVGTMPPAVVQPPVVSGVQPATIPGASDLIGQAQKKLGDAQSAVMGTLANFNLTGKPAPTQGHPAPHTSVAADMTIIRLPDALARRVPAGHTLRRHSGTLEHTRSDNYNGQRNFILHPIPGEEQYTLRMSNGRMGVTDLRIDEMSGHPVWMYSFVSQSGNIGNFLCQSRATGAWVTLHDHKVMVHLFDSRQDGAASVGSFVKSFGIAYLTGSPKLGNIVAESDKKKRLGLSDQQAHELILDIRSFIEATFMETQSQGQRL